MPEYIFNPETLDLKPIKKNKPQMNKTQELARLIHLIVIKQWFHSIFALVNTNRPNGLFGADDPNYMAANKIQDLAWKRYCALGEEISELAKTHDLSKFVF